MTSGKKHKIWKMAKIAAVWFSMKKKNLDDRIPENSEVYRDPLSSTSEEEWEQIIRETWPYEIWDEETGEYVEISAIDESVLGEEPIEPLTDINDRTPFPKLHEIVGIEDIDFDDDLGKKATRYEDRLREFQGNEFGYLEFDDPESFHEKVLTWLEENDHNYEHAPCGEGKARIMAGDIYEGAKRFYRKIIRKDPKSVKARVSLAYIYSNQGHHGRALQLLRKAASLGPENVHICQSLSLETLLSGDEEGAKQVCWDYIEKFPKEFVPHHALGNVYSIAKKYANARRSYLRAYELTGWDEFLEEMDLLQISLRIRPVIGKETVKEGDQKEKIKSLLLGLTQPESSKEDDARAKIRMGLSCYAEGIFDMAFSEWQEALSSGIKLDPKTKADLHFYMGLIAYSHMRDHDKAEYRFRRSIHFNPENYRARLALAHVMEHPLIGESDLENSRVSGLGRSRSLSQGYIPAVFDQYEKAAETLFGDSKFLLSVQPFGDSSCNIFMNTSHPLDQCSFLAKGFCEEEITDEQRDRIREEYRLSSYLRYVLQHNSVCFDMNFLSSEQQPMADTGLMRCYTIIPEIVKILEGKTEDPRIIRHLSPLAGIHNTKRIKYIFEIINLKNGMLLSETSMSPKDRNETLERLVTTLGLVQGSIPTGLFPKRDLLADVQTRLECASLPRGLVDSIAANYDPLMKMFDKSIWVFNDDFHPENILIGEYPFIFLIDHEPRGLFPITMDFANLTQYSRRLLNPEKEKKFEAHLLDLHRMAYNSAAGFFNERLEEAHQEEGSFGYDILYHILRELYAWKDGYYPDGISDEIKRLTVGIPVSSLEQTARLLRRRAGEAPPEKRMAVSSLVEKIIRSLDKENIKPLIEADYPLDLEMLNSTIHRAFTYYGFFFDKPAKYRYRRDWLDNALFAIRRIKQLHPDYHQEHQRQYTSLEKVLSELRQKA